jgi:hypothetical protein
MPLMHWKALVNGKAVVSMLAVLALLIAFRADAATLHVKVVDKTGAAFPDVLVIVKSLEGKGEIARALTDSTGSVSGRELPPGLYRVIATCPYGICETNVQEFYVKDAPVQLELTVDVSPTRGEGDVVEIGPSRPLNVQVIDRDGRPARLAPVLVRNADAQHERWYKTDSDGGTKVELPEGQVTVVVLYGGTITPRTLSVATIAGLKAKGTPLVIHLGTGQEASISKPVSPPSALVHELGHADPQKQQ